MRRVAQALDTGHASLYVYVKDTADLHSALLDGLVGPIVKNLPPVSEDTWRDSVVQLLRDYYSVLATHPQVVLSTMKQPRNGPNHAALLEHVLELMSAGGISRRAAALVVDLLLLYPNALALEHPYTDEQSESWTPPDDLSTLPQIAAMGSRLRAGTPSERFRWTVSLILDGAQAARG